MRDFSHLIILQKYNVYIDSMPEETLDTTTTIPQGTMENILNLTLHPKRYQSKRGRTYDLQDQARLDYSRALAKVSLLSVLSFLCFFNFFAFFFFSFLLFYLFIFGLTARIDSF